MSSTVVFRCIRVWVVHFRGGFIEVFGRPPPEVGPAGPVSEIRSEFPGRVLSTWYQSFRFPVLFDY